MKIVQDDETGEVKIQLDANEDYYLERHLDALTDFVIKQAVEIHTLTNSYQELAKRVEVLEKSSSELNQQSKTN
jgi:hypothetical protein